MFKKYLVVALSGLVLLSACSTTDDFETSDTAYVSTDEVYEELDETKMNESTDMDESTDNDYEEDIDSNENINTFSDEFIAQDPDNDSHLFDLFMKYNIHINGNLIKPYLKLDKVIADTGMYVLDEDIKDEYKFDKINLYNEEIPEGTETYDRDKYGTIKLKAYTKEGNNFLYSISEFASDYQEYGKPIIDIAGVSFDTDANCTVEEYAKNFELDLDSLEKITEEDKNYRMLCGFYTHNNGEVNIYKNENMYVITKVSDTGWLLTLVNVIDDETNEFISFSKDNDKDCLSYITIHLDNKYDCECRNK